MRALALTGLLCFAAGCGATPFNVLASNVTVTVPSTTAVSSGQSRVSLGRTEQMSASVTSGSGAVDAAPAGTWGTDAPGVATVNAAGLVTTLSPGDVTIFFDSAAGSRGTKHLTVVGDFNGLWAGTYQLSGCTETGDFAANGFCATFTNGLSGPYTVSMTQTSTTINASWTLASSMFGYSSAATADGTFGTATSPTAARADTNFASTTSFQLSQTGIGQIAGTVQVTFTSPRLAGSGRFTGRIGTANRSTVAVPTNVTFFGAPSTFTDLRTALVLR